MCRVHDLDVWPDTLEGAVALPRVQTEKEGSKSETMQRAYRGTETHNPGTQASS